MSTDNNQDNERIDVLEAALQALAGAQRVYEETQRQQTASIQRHDMFLEMFQATQQELAESHRLREETQRELAESHRLHEETQREQTAAIQRHDMLLEMALATQRDLVATQERQEDTQNRMTNLLQTLSTMLYRVIDTQQEHGHAIRGLEENRDNAP